MNQNGYESQNVPGFGQPYNNPQNGYNPPVQGGYYFSSNQPSGYPPVSSAVPPMQGGGYSVNAPSYQPPVNSGYIPGAGTAGYQPPQMQTNGYQGSGYPGYPAGYMQSAQSNNGYSPYGGDGNNYSAPPRAGMYTGGSYIPPTPYSTGNTNPDYRQMQVGYQQGYSAIGQMGRPAQETDSRKADSRQMPLNGGGYTPERVPVRRRPFEMTDTVIYATGGLLILLFALAMFAFNSTAMKILFLLLAGGTTAALWVKPLTAENKRLCYTIVALILCIVTIVSFFTGKNTADTKNNEETGATAQTANGYNYTGSGQTSGSGQAVITPYPADNTSTAVYGTGSEGAEEDEATKQRLYLFLQYWNANRLDEMLTVCAPSWVSKQESPKTALFQILKNRTPINFEIVELKGTSQDKSRQIILKCEIDRHTGKGTIWYQLSVIMLKEGDQWYVDPLSIQTNEVEETPDPNVTPTPAPTAEPQYDANTVLYYNPDGGSMYHADPNCTIIAQKYLPLKGHFTYAQINDPEYAKLEPCNVCNSPLR